MKANLIAFAVALLAAATVGVVQLTAQAADNTRDCDKYAIVYCGTMSAGEARNKYNQKDHAAVFRNFGIAKHEITNDMKHGVVYRDGTVRVGGKVVARSATTAIRHVGGKSIPGSATAKRVSVSKMGSAQTALVKFDKNGRFMFAIMKPCGNPVTGNPTKPKPKPKPQPKPAAKCVSLKATKIDRTRVRLNAKVEAKNGAKINAYIFVVTKGGKEVYRERVASNKQQASHVYRATGPGNYRAKVLVRTSAGEKKGPQCTAQFTVKPKPEQPEKPEKKPGIEVTKLVENEKFKQVGVNVEYNYQISVRNTGNKVLKNVKVTDTPEAGVTLLSASEGEIEGNTWTHTIAQLGVGETVGFTLTAKVPEYLAGRIDNTVCVDAPEIPGNPDDCDNAEVEVPKAGQVPVCDPKTGETIRVDEDEADNYVPVGSPECEEAEEKPEGKGSTDIKELPRTGPADVIMQMIGAAFMTGSGAYYLASRRLS